MIQLAVFKNDMHVAKSITFKKIQQSLSLKHSSLFFPSFIVPNKYNAES
jgi:hypothetical protein